MKHKPKDMSDPNVLRAEAARTSEAFDRITRGRTFESRQELEQFMQSIQGKSLDEMEMPELTPRDKAQDLIYDAWELTSSRQRVKLARAALELWPDCADAYSLLAEEAESKDEERRLLEEAVAAGERAIGPEPFKEDVGHFWGIHATRPYMRARLALAQFHWAEGEDDAAIRHARELLRLNTNDNQGVRYCLVGWLLAVGNNNGAIWLLDHYDEETAGWLYARSLVEFRQLGDVDDARRTLVQAFASNKTLPEYLIALCDPAGKLPGSFRRGTDDEAVIVFQDLAEAWDLTPGALDWLRDRWLEDSTRRR